MNLEDYICFKNSCRKILRKLDEKIENGVSQEKQIFLTNQRNYLQNIKTVYEKKISELCVHEFEDDLIDIDPDKSVYIRYCKICEYTVH
jgi:hypothetical protein